jgi:hypothetical protein
MGAGHIGFLRFAPQNHFEQPYHFALLQRVECARLVEPAVAVELGYSASASLVGAGRCNPLPDKLPMRTKTFPATAAKICLLDGCQFAWDRFLQEKYMSRFERDFCFIALVSLTSDSRDQHVQAARRWSTNTTFQNNMHKPDESLDASRFQNVPRIK